MDINTLRTQWEAWQSANKAKAKTLSTKFTNDVIFYGMPKAQDGLATVIAGKLNLNHGEVLGLLKAIQ